MEDNVEVNLEDKIQKNDVPYRIAPTLKKTKTGGQYYEIFQTALIKKMIINEY